MTPASLRFVFGSIMALSNIVVVFAVLIAVNLTVINAGVRVARSPQFPGSFSQAQAQAGSYSGGPPGPPPPPRFAHPGNQGFSGNSGQGFGGNSGPGFGNRRPVFGNSGFGGGNGGGFGGHSGSLGSNAGTISISKSISISRGSGGSASSSAQSSAVAGK